MSNKLKLQDHITDLQLILDTINTLPEKGVDAYAVIAVTYPEGSVCTCSNGSETFELDDTVGYGFFLIPNAGEWTVTVTDGTSTKSETVEITAEGQFASVALKYRTYVFTEGVGLDAKYTIKEKGSKVSFGTDAIKCTGDSTGFVLEPAIPGSTYKTLCFDMEITTGRSDIYATTFGVSDTVLSNYWGDAGYASTRLEGTVSRSVQSVDISAVTADGYIKLLCFYSRWSIYNIWLEV